MVGTPQDQVLNPGEAKQKAGMLPEEIARMEQEMESLGSDLKAVEATYGENMLNLTCMSGYIKRLLDNAKVVRSLNGNYPDILSESEQLAAVEAV